MISGAGGMRILVGMLFLFFFMMRTVASVRERHFYDAVNGYKML